ncbi:unnamed protein product [Aphanomyces euteiches]
MEASMVLSAAIIKEPDDVAQVTKLMADLRTSVDNDKCPEIVASLKDLPAALEKAVYVYEKYPLIVDETGQAAQFFKYQRGCFLMAGSPNDMAAAALRARSLLAGLELDQFFDDTWFPSQVVDRHELFKPEVWTPLLRPAEGDPDPSMFLPNDAFKFAILCGNIEPPPRTLARMCLVRVVRNSVQLVEAGFDGDIEALKALLDKGYHLESEDGHKHTALSEAACQGHEEVLEWLLSLGANPNALNDAGRSPLYRAAYNGHSSVITLLLKAGADPRLTTKQGERPFDVAKSKEIADLLAEWDVAVTDKLMEERRRIMEKKLEECLTSHVEREQLAMMRIRDELVGLATSTASLAAEQLKELLLNLAGDAVKNDEKPRGCICLLFSLDGILPGTAEARDDRGSTLLALAAQYDNADVATMLLTHWKASIIFQDDSHPLIRHDEKAKQVYLKVFRVNVNARDQKGWTPIAIAVFHQSKRTARVLLEHGANPRLKNQNKNAMDLAQDELDAALNVVTSRQEIRKVLEEWESHQLASTLENSRNKIAVGAAEPLPADGGATLLAIEVASEAQANATKGKAKKKKAPRK